jgi:threonyl-tRNA synthetase
MKTLNLHCDYIKFKGLKKALKKVDEIAPKQELEGSSKECLVVMIAVESGDSKGSVGELVKNVKDVASSVGAKNVVLYPYAHLSKDLGKPEVAVEVLNEAGKKLKKDFSVVSAPFGYYKSFELKVKGHPLSELSREIKGGVVKGDEAEDLSDKEREKLWKIMSKIKMQSIRGEDDKKSNVELGKELDLYIVNEVIGQGLPLLTPKGAAIQRELENFIVTEELKRGYEYTSTPIMAKSDLYKISGHWYHFKDDMFTLDVHGEEFALRPMTCPFQFVLYKRKPRSYKDLPKKYAEIATLFRNEKSGELRGLTRVRQFNLADAHLICTPEQVEEEFGKVIELVNFMMKNLGIDDIWYRFSKWDPKNKEGKFIDSPKAWASTEKSMKKILDNLKIKYKEAKGEAAFYGPKLDLQYKDVYGKEDTLLTVQIDFALPDKFGLTYLDKNGKEKKPIIIHRSAAGATERVMAYLLEKTQGSLPLWLSPVQVKILTMNEEIISYANEVKEKLLLEGIRVETDFSDESISKKIRNGYADKAYYMLALGKNEQSAKKLAVRERGVKEISEMNLNSFVEKLKKEILEKK